MRVVRGKREAAELFSKRSQQAHDAGITETVARIISEVRERGDSAVREFSERFDGAAPQRLRVDAEQFDRARETVPAQLAEAIRLSVRRVEEFYRRQPAQGFSWQEGDDLLGQVVRPLQRVGCYVPGGTAPLFSSLIMLAVPAKVAGVEEIIAVTPPRPDGTVAPEILLAADAAGVHGVYAVGGAQAIAALAFGTESIPRVDKVVGPGNRYVVAAKRLLYGVVGIESLPGPTETLVLADESASISHVVADLLAQAEHVGAEAVLVTTSEDLAQEVPDALERALADLPTAGFARESLARRGTVVVVESLTEGVEVANEYAPEHLCLLVENPGELLPLVRNAGGVFLGHSSMEALGDYAAGPSHVMPTGGTARFASAVNVSDFQRIIPIVGVSRDLLAKVGPAATVMARAEGLEAHARAIEARLGERTETE